MHGEKKTAVDSVAKFSEGTQRRCERTTMDADNVKRAIVEFGDVKERLKEVMGTAKGLRERKTDLTNSIKEFMELNELDACKVENLPTTIKKIRYVERESKEPISCKLLEEWFSTFFDSIDPVGFIALSSEDKSKEFFGFLDSKRKRKLLKTVVIS